MTALPRRRRNRSLAMLAATIIVAVSVPVLGWVGVQAVLDSTGGRDARADNLPIKTFPATPTAMYLTTDDDGALSSVSVFVLAPSGAGGSIVSVPANADVGLSAGARQSLQQVYADGGVDAMVLAIESLLLVAVNDTAVADPAQVATFLTPFAPFTVELATAVEAGDDGEGELPAGTAVLQAENAARVLTSGATAEAGGSTSARQGNVDALWRGVVAAVGTGRPTAKPETAAPESFDEFVGRLFAGQTQSRGLTATDLTGDQNPDQLDVVELDRSEVVLVFASVAPGSMSAPADGPKFRLEAPAGYDEQVETTIDQLQFLHANVVSVDTTGPTRTDTVFLVPDDSNRVLVQATDGIFGEITFGTPTERIDNVDVTVQLGTEFLDGLAS